MQARPPLAHPTLVCMAAYLLAVPLLLALTGPGLSAYDAARAAQLGLLPVIAALGVRTPLPNMPVWLRRAAATLAALGLLSCLFAANPWMALREFLNLASLLALAALLAAQGAEALHWLPRVAALAVMAYAAPVLCMALVGAAQGLPLAADLPLPGFANRRYFNHVQTVALPLAAYGVIAFESRALRLLTGAGLLASMVLLCITLGRGSLMGCAAAIGVLGVLRWRGRRELGSLLLLFAGSLLLAALLAAVLQGLAAPGSPGPELTEAPAAQELASDHSRFGLWQRAWDMAVASPLLGAGPMHYAYGNHDKAAHPHSLPLQLLAEWGGPASLVVGLVGTWLMIALVRRVRASTGRDGQLGACLLACWASVFVDSWVSGLWVMPVSQMWLAALMGLSGAWLSPPPRAPAAQRWNLIPLLLCSGLLLHALPELAQLRAHLNGVRQAFPGEGARPRFWSEGHFGPFQSIGPR